MNHTGLKQKMKKLITGNIKAVCSLIIFIIGSLSMWGQDNKDTKEKILEIKLNDDFIFGEGVSDDKDIAYGVALDDLLLFANDIKERNSQDKLSMSDLITNVETLVYQNGSRFEVIVYLPFKIVIETNHKQPTAGSGIIITKPGVIESTETEDPIVEETVATIEDEPLDIPSTQETPVENILPVEDLIAETTPIENNSKIEDNIIPANPEEDRSIVEEVKTEATSEEANTSNEEGFENFNAPIVSNKDIPESNINSLFIGEVEEFLLTQDNFSEIKSFMSEMKGKGIISETGATESIVDLPQDASLILMDEFGGILAILSPIGTNGRINYKDQKNDSENNYNSKFILWYRK